MWIFCTILRWESGRGMSSKSMGSWNIRGPSNKPKSKPARLLAYHFSKTFETMLARLLCHRRLSMNPILSSCPEGSLWWSLQCPSPIAQAGQGRRGQAKRRKGGHESLLMEKWHCGGYNVSAPALEKPGQNYNHRYASNQQEPHMATWHRSSFPLSLFTHNLKLSVHPKGSELRLLRR